MRFPVFVTLISVFAIGFVGGFVVQTRTEKTQNVNVDVQNTNSDPWFATQSLYHAEVYENPFFSYTLTIPSPLYFQSRTFFADTQQDVAAFGTDDEGWSITVHSFINSENLPLASWIAVKTAFDFSMTPRRFGDVEAFFGTREPNSPEERKHLTAILDGGRSIVIVTYEDGRREMPEKAVFERIVSSLKKVSL